MSYVAETVREMVRQRAANRCEYCLSQQDYVLGRMQVDHVWPVAKGGADTDDNLCLACELRNQYKWARTHGTDPLSGSLVELFNPRQDDWNEHFTWSEDSAEIIGLTPKAARRWRFYGSTTRWQLPCVRIG